MIAFGTLGRYFGRRFFGAVMVTFIACAGLIALVDFLETTRRFGDRPNASFTMISYLVALRLPAFTEQLLPFAVLLGGMGTFLTFSRRLEFVIARSAGMSVWQFTGSSIAIALLLGVFAVTIYNPFSAALKEQANQVEATFLTARPAQLAPRRPEAKGGPGAPEANQPTAIKGPGKEAPRAADGKGRPELAGKGDSSKVKQQTNVRAGGGIWVRQQSVDGQSIIQAETSFDNGRRLNQVRIFSFDNKGKFLERIEAQTARLLPGTWVLQQVKVFSIENEPQEYDTYHVSTNLTSEQVRGRLASADSLSFWNLPDAIEATERAGLRPERYQLQYQSLLARPLLLVAMVVIAAMVSLRLFRFGGVGKMIVGGVVAGFLLYVSARLAEELGESGIIHPIAAAWFPAVFGSLMGGLVLLNQEDG
jgi:lipopolysaccharide export system permease protein